jgi:hypothetical protein
VLIKVLLNHFGSTINNMFSAGKETREKPLGGGGGGVAKTRVKLRLLLNLAKSGKGSPEEEIPSSSVQLRMDTNRK